MVPGFIGMSLLVLLTAGRPVYILILAGTVNGLVWPAALGTLLTAARTPIVPGHTPGWLLLSGWTATATTLFLNGHVEPLILPFVQHPGGPDKPEPVLSSVATKISTLPVAGCAQALRSRLAVRRGCNRCASI